MAKTKVDDNEEVVGEVDTPTTKKAKKAGKYDSKSIITLRFPENVRQNAGMFIGGTDSYARWIVAKELLDNGLDEALAGRNDYVWLDITDGVVTVIDNGHGVPQGIKKYEIVVGDKTIKAKMPTMQAVFGELNTSGKYRSEAYAVSVGTHGVGAKATNATAEFFEVVTYYDGAWHSIRFKQGKLSQGVTKAKAPKAPDGTVLKRGTLVRFKHDPAVFGKKEGAFPLKYAKEWGEVMAYLTPGLKVRISEKGKDVARFFSKNGPRDYITARHEKLKVQDAEKTLLEYHSELADVVLSFTSHNDCDLRGFTNGSFNREGGKHVESVSGALYKALLKAGNVKMEKAKKKGERAKAPFSEGDMKDGIVGLVNAKLHKAQFNSQDKVRLADDRVGSVWEKELVGQFVKFFDANKAMTKRLIERCLALASLRTKFVASKKVVSELNKLRSKGMPAKYAPASSKIKTQDRELLLVEGDSAAGTIRRLRGRHQALLPLKGKILNALKDSKGKAMESEEVLYILSAIGYNPKAADPLAKLNFGKIICVADPDPDGPFVGDTMIRVKLHNEDRELPIHHLVTLTNEGDKFQVPVFTGGAEQWCNATAELVGNVDTLVALEINGAKLKVSEGHKFVVVRTPSVRERIAEPMSDTLAFIEARNLRIGDRVWMPSQEGVRKSPNVDRSTGRGFAAINKLRVQKQTEPVPVYCLTVPKHHHFVLPSGIVSGNCHINSLLLALFYKYMPELFQRGMIYVADAPEFYAQYKKEYVFGYTLSETQANLKKLGAPASTECKHIKGWGEPPDGVVRKLLLNEDTRNLIKLNAVEQEDHVDFVKLMNEDVQYRREMLGLPERASGSSDDGDEDDKPKGKKGKKAKKQKAAEPESKSDEKAVKKSGKASKTKKVQKVKKVKKAGKAKKTKGE